MIVLSVVWTYVNAADREAIDTLSYILPPCVAAPIYQSPHIQERAAKSKGEARNKKAAAWLKNAAAFADRYFLKNVDTAYLTLPKHRFRIALSGDYGSVYSHLRCTNVPYYEDVTVDMGSNITPKVGFVVSYRNMNFGYSWDLYRGYSNLKFSLLQNGFGIDLYRRKTMHAGGFIESSGTNKRLELTSSDVASTTFFLSGYIALNRRRFSMPAAFNASFIQKRSAGSVLIVANFMYNSMEFQSEELIGKSGGLRELELYQVAVGAGYGHNFSVAKGKFLFHISVTPMLAVFSRMLTTGNVHMFIADVNYPLVLTRKITPIKPYVYVTGQAKAAFVYNINQRFVLCFNGIVNNMRFRSKDNFMAINGGSTVEYPEISLHLNTLDWNAVLVLGVRFL